MKPTVFINGKFAAQRVTGVQRFALELVRALDARLGADAPIALELLLPPGAAPPPFRAVATRVVAGSARLHLWEQLALPRAARGGVLLNLTGSAPFGHRRQVASLLDTAIYDYPDAYSTLFVAFYRRLFAWQARRARLVLTLTEFTRDALVDRLAPRAPVVVVGAAADQFAALVPAAPLPPPADGRPYLLAVGSANPTKNFPRLIAAFAQLTDPDLRLVIVGGRNAAVFAGGIGGADDPRIVWAGPVPDAELKALYQGALAFVFPSIYEGFGLPPLEAMICGCPVVAAAAASIPEVCGNAALYFDPLDVAAIRGALERIVADRSLRDALRAAGTARAGRYTWERSAEVLFRALLAVVIPRDDMAAGART